MNKHPVVPALGCTRPEGSTDILSLQICLVTMAVFWRMSTQVMRVGCLFLFLTKWAGSAGTELVV